ncbi:phosphoribosyltransferase family protein [Yinghuangia seranimata]|uniref:phosphoribosyltransferase family protein n=1 Tax=Yinghuangia seranimata TaxID=408067 RepID=UPI00248ADE8E|nr:phosphoribosyltransferase family protein [Yinghuangia seranimata]MDI2126718.1 phosphoribosyltransferase family protein [Yinghuangia seranimata]
MTDRQRVVQRLTETFAWADTPVGVFADLSGWWRDPELLGLLGPALADLHSARKPTVVAGIETRGLVLGPLTALALGVGFVEVRKAYRIAGEAQRDADDPMLRAETPPEYQDGGLTLMAPRRLFTPDDRVLLVDEWIESGAQAHAVRRMVAEAGAQWAGVAVIVDATEPRVREHLDVRGLVGEDDLPA